MKPSPASVPDLHFAPALACLRAALAPLEPPALRLEDAVFTVTVETPRPQGVLPAGMAELRCSALAKALRQMWGERDLPLRSSLLHCCAAARKGLHRRIPPRPA